MRTGSLTHFKQVVQKLPGVLLRDGFDILGPVAAAAGLLLKDPAYESFLGAVRQFAPLLLIKEAELFFCIQSAVRGGGEIWIVGGGFLCNDTFYVYECVSVDLPELFQGAGRHIGIGQDALDIIAVFICQRGAFGQQFIKAARELAQLMQDLGCVTAYNLDGGGSSTIWFNGRVLNRPTTYGKQIEERSLSDIVYIGQPQR